MDRLLSANNKVEQYEQFVDQRLKPDLVHAVAQRDKVLEKQQILSDLAKNIKLLEQNQAKNVRTMVNLGSEVYVQAEVPDTSRIFVNVGLGFHVEFTLTEASQFIAWRQKILANQIEAHTQQIGSIKGQIKLVLEGIRELMNIPANDDAPMR